MIQRFGREQLGMMFVLALANHSRLVSSALFQ